MENNISYQMELTITNVAGLLIIITGVLSLFTINDAGFASTCIVTGAGLVGVAKVANTMYDNAHIEK